MIHRSAAVAALCLLAAPALAQLSSFDTTAQGWQVADAPLIGHIPTPVTSIDAAWHTFGRPAGGLRVPDVYARTWIAAPASYLGDRGDAQGQQLLFDIFIRANDFASSPAVALVGADRTLFFVTPLQNGVWNTVAPMLDPWEGWVVNDYQNGPFATFTDFQIVLNDLRAFLILTEWSVNGADDTSIDNVFFPGTPPPPPPTCDPDFNGDGNVDQDDVICIINVVAGSAGCTAQDPDFNRDGNVDQEDVVAVIGAVAGGGCP